MQQRTAWALLIGLGITMAGAGLVLAQAGSNDLSRAMAGSNDLSRAVAGSNDLSRDVYVGHPVGASTGTIFVDDHAGSLGEDTFIAAGGFDGCNGSGFGDGLGQVADIDVSGRETVRAAKDVDADEDDILLGIALANNGAHGIEFEDLTDVTTTSTVRASVDEEVDLDRDDVFSALALGFDADHADSLDALVCVRDLDRDIARTETDRRRIDLEEDNVLLAIALSNSVGSPLRLSDVADVSRERTTELDTRQNVDIDRQDAFLALALGAGGH